MQEMDDEEADVDDELNDNDVVLSEDAPTNIEPQKPQEVSRNNFCL